MKRGTSLSCAPLLEDSVGHDECLIFVFWYELVGYVPDSAVEQLSLSGLVVEEGSLFDLPGLFDAHREGITHLSLLFDLPAAL